MNKQSVTNVTKSINRWSAQHSPEILMGLGVAGMVTSTFLAVKATPRAIRLIEIEDNRRGSQESRRHPLTKLEIVKIAWKPYIPAVVTGVVSVTCLIGSSSISVRRSAALATAYKLSETAFSEFKTKTIETVGEKKVQEIKEKVISDKIEQTPINKSEVIITSRGDTMFYESISGRYFKSSIDKIDKAVNELNRRMTYENYISLTDFYDEIGLPNTSISDHLGWNLGKGHIVLEKFAKIADDGNPCIGLDYSYAPIYEYDKYW